jgi:hypothetical protein
MKYYQCWSAIILILFFSLTCKRNLDQPPIGLVDESLITNKKGVEGLLIGAYSLLDGVSVNSDDPFPNQYGGSGSNWTYGSICGSEAYKGSTLVNPEDQPEITALETFAADSRNGYVAQKWQKVYAGVQRSNEVLRILKKANDIRSPDSIRITAEARFLRGFYHFEAIKVFHKVPYVDETITYEAGNYHLPNDTLIWGAIENDFRFAMDNLKDKMDAVGRANKYVAMAYLAKAFLFQGQTDARKFMEAKPLLEELIRNGVTAGGIPFHLLQHYNDNFNPETKNSSESVFAVQMSVQDGSDGKNGNLGDILNYPSGGGPGTCCGFFQPSQYLVNHFKTDPGTGLPDLDHFNEVPVKNDEGLSSTDPFTPYAGTLDPRLDWTVGRRGIPYLDWGLHPGKDWIRDPSFSFGPYSPIKNTYFKSQQEHLTDPGFWNPGATATNINLIRFSDILLWAAEVEAEVGSLEKARDFVNQVRLRAADSSGWVKMDNGSSAANYKIGLYTLPWTNQTYARKAIHFERMLELAMEGHRFFDLVRWGIADQEIKSYLEKEKMFRTYLNQAQFKKGINEVFPIPQTQIDLSAGADGIPKLKQNPGYN